MAERGMPDRAFVLAAGLGTRLLPLTRERAKPMFPMWGKPLLVHTLEQLTLWGVKEVLINLHHRPGDVVEGLRTFPLPGLKINYSMEPEILGTGGGLVKAAWFTRERPFWLVNGDVWMDLDPGPLVKAFRSRGVLASAWVTAEAGPRTVDVAGGEIRSFRSQRAGSEGTATFCGVHLVRPEVLDFLPGQGFSSVIAGYEAAMKKGWRIAGTEVAGSRWFDIGSPANYLAAHRADAGEGFVSTEGCVEIGAGCDLRDVIVWSGATVPEGVALSHAIVASGVTVPGDGGTDIFQAGATALDAGEKRLVKAAGFDPEQAVINAHPQRGSARRYSRVIQGRRRALLMAYDGRREENRLFAGHMRLLKAMGLNVPDILAEDEAAERVVVEDVGDDSVETLFPGWSKAKHEKIMDLALDQLILLHRDGLAAVRKAKRVLMPGFDSALYAWEHDLFLREGLKGKVELTAQTENELRGELGEVAGELEGLPKVLVHRDFQSSNLLVRRGRIYVIDVQGMREGPAAYDLASLVYDPYIDMDDDMIEHVIAGYRARRPGVSVRQVRRAGIQRLVQALGAFGRLSRLPGQARFAGFVRPAARRLGRLTEAEGGLPTLSAVARDLAG